MAARFAVFPAIVITPGAAVFAPFPAILVRDAADQAACNRTPNDGARISIRGKRSAKHADAEGDGALLFSGFGGCGGHERNNHPQGNGQSAERFHICFHLILRAPLRWLRSCSGA